MPETNNANETRTKCTALQGGKNAGKPCYQWALPGSDRCTFHPLKDAEIEALQAEGATTLPAEARRAVSIQARLNAAPMSEAEMEDTDGLETEPLPPGVEPTDTDTVRVVEFDSEADDYVVRTVPRALVKPVVDVDPTEFNDAFGLGAAYHQGDNALFDYRWCNSDERQNLADRSNGFVPVRKSADNLHRVQAGVVSNGDLVLMRRPKEKTEQRARAQAALHDRNVGDYRREYEEEARDAARAAGVDLVPTFGGVSESQGAYSTEVDPDRESSRQAARFAPEPARPRGARSYSFPNNPLARDKSAESRGSVGG